MSPLFKILFTGLLVSFLGSLPLGTLNIASMQISVSEGMYSAMLFSLGSLLAEIIYVRLSLVAMDWVRKQELFFKILEWVTLLIVLALAAFSFYAALNPAEHENKILSSRMPKIPFWFGWSTVLFSKKILLPQNNHYNFYILGIAFGTFTGNLVFILGGQIIADSINNNQHILSWIIGGIFTITAIIQIRKMMKKKDAVHEIRHPETITHRMENKLEKIVEEADKTFGRHQ
jgi:threonine/homoserine/homoserine lactone efflux protein